MKRIAVIGATGMLGSAVSHALSSSHQVLRIYRNKKMLDLLDARYPEDHLQPSVSIDMEMLYRAFIEKKGIEAMDAVVSQIGPVDSVVNCIGIIRPPSGADQGMTFFVNSALPHLLAAAFGKKLIHISTDCVFDGITGAPYNERSKISPVDIYGLSKSLGEPHERALVLRTSLIGIELTGAVSLLGWMLSQPQHATVRGYANHLWSGITAEVCGTICDAIISRTIHMPKIGLFHIYGQEITKYNLLAKAAALWRPDLNIVRFKSDFPVDRRLTSVYPFAKALKIPSVDTMLKRLTPVVKDAMRESF